MNCGNCNKTDGYIYTSNPPMIFCTVANEYYFLDHECDLPRCEKHRAASLKIPLKEVTLTTAQWQWFDGVYCSNCHYKLETTGIPSYCPNCGAKMME